MAQTIQWTSTVVVAGSTTLSLTRSLNVEAVDIIDFSLLGTSAASGADSDKEVELQPGTTAGQVQFLAITSDRYGDSAHGVEYKVNDATNPAVRLDEPLVLGGAGAVSLINASPIRLFFSSTLAENATIHIIVGRDATP